MILVDLSQIAISSLMAEIRKTGTDVPIDTNMVRYFVLNSLRYHNSRFRDEFGGMVITCDSRKSWRKSAFKHYKANRKKDRDKSGLDWNALFGAIDLIKEELREFFPYPMIEVEGAEADDIIASIAHWSQKHYVREDAAVFATPMPVLILSGDHDFVQLQKYANITQFSPIQKSWIKPSGTPNDVLMEHIIRGDAGDGVPNYLSGDRSFVDGIRQKSITKRIVAEAQTMVPDKYAETLEPRLRRNFNRNRVLVDLSCIPKDLYETIIRVFEDECEAKKDADRRGLTAYFISHGVGNLMEYVSDF